jgi:hypothetical protein
MDERDLQHLNLLGVFYYIWAALNAAVLLLLVVIAGLLLAGVMASSAQNEPDAAALATILTVIFIPVLLITGALTVLTFLAAHGLQNQRRKILIYIIAALTCTSVPLGTILGIFTFLVMARPGVGEAFDADRGYVS